MNKIKFGVKKTLFVHAVFFTMYLYLCPFSGPTKVTLCENSQRTITCPPGSNLRIFSAFFGRSNRKVCRGTIRTLRCSSKNALAKARGLCDGRQSCNVRASVSVFGDPCRGTSKYLEVSYACQSKSEVYFIIQHYS